jgi:hypothetical protein
VRSPPTTSKGREPRRMLCQWPATTIIPSLHPTQLVVRIRLAAGSLSGRLEGFSLASCSLDAPATPHLLSLTPHSGQLLSFSSATACFSDPLDLYCDTTVLSRRSRYSRLSLFLFRNTLDCELRAASREPRGLLHLPIAFSCMKPNCR